jgi:murein DD-endopeptidase MepM/ murein hydrolase activator NlpD
MRIVRLSARFLLTVAAAAMLSACSSSLERFSAENTAYDNPSDADPVYTAGIQRAKPRKLKTVDDYQAPEADPIVEEAIVSKPLAKAAINKPKLAYDYTNAYQKKPAYKQPKLTMSEDAVEREPAYEAPAESEFVAPAKKLTRPKLAMTEPAEVTQPAEVAAKPAVVPKSGRIRVQPGMTLAGIAKTNGVSVEELAKANGLKKPYWVSAGTVLLVPGVVNPTAPRTTLQAQKQQVEEQGTSLAVEEEINATPKKVVASTGAHTVGSGETLYSLGRKYGVTPFAIAEANGLARDASLSVGQNVKIPGASAKVASAAPKLAAKPKQVEEEVITDEEPQVFAKPAKKKLVIEEEPKQEAEVAETKVEEPVVEEKVAEAPVKKELKLKEPKVETAAPAAQALALRWPVRGKVISEFGPKSGGLKNEGINISVPEGTSIRAAESGVVAYAGNELKGYGNLILIRHDGGYVTAYAHAKELIVKRGDKVKRGDVIAKAGQTGAVSSPQVHFEVRKGASALDPNKFLGSSTAMN